MCIEKKDIYIFDDNQYFYFFFDQMITYSLESMLYLSFGTY